MKSNVQVVIEQLRAKYAEIPRPFLSQVCLIYNLSVRDFAGIFGISKTHAADIIQQRKMPSLELGIRIARYLEVSVEELFGWRVDDDGSRRPLAIDLRSQRRRIVLKAKHKDHGTMSLINAVAEAFRELNAKYVEYQKQEAENAAG